WLGRVVVEIERRLPRLRDVGLNRAAWSNTFVRVVRLVVHRGFRTRCVGPLKGRRLAGWEVARPRHRRLGAARWHTTLEPFRRSRSRRRRNDGPFTERRTAVQLVAGTDKTNTRVGEVWPEC